MAGFGGAVKLTGEDSYKKALQSITQSLKVVSAEMKASASAFEVGDKSTKELANDSKALKSSLDAQKAALSDLKNQLAQMTAEYQKNEQRLKTLNSQLDSEKNKLDSIGKTLGTSSTEYKEQEKVVNDLEKEIKRSTTEYERQGKAINDARIKTANAETTINDTAKALDKMGDEAKESGEDAKKGSEGYTVLKNILANLATVAIVNAVNGLKKLGSTLIDVGKQAIESYGEYEQLEGGVKKLFGTSAKSAEDYAEQTGLSLEEAETAWSKYARAEHEVLANAEKAYATAGLSANEYMETVTSFSAALISGLGGDTEKAVSYADTAIRDMADNANTFGTDIESIQNAYQGFAKGNFTMLDNLKLGYGGTKTEMLRLVQEAGVVDKSVKSLDDVSFDQMIQAIHIVQQEMNITGTTAAEAANTMQGATGSFKAAWQNLLTGMADENADFKSLTSNLIGTLVTEDGKGGLLGNLIPRISTVISGMSTAISTALPQLISSVVPLLQANLPIVLSAVGELLQSVVATIPAILPVIKDFLSQALQIVLGMTPELVNSGVAVILALLQGISEAIPLLTAELPTIIDTCVTIITENLPLIIDAGISLLDALISGILTAIPILIQKLPEVISAILNTITSELPKILAEGEAILDSLISGILQTIPLLTQMLPTIIDTIVSFVMENLPVILNSGIDILLSLINGIVDAIPLLIQMLPVLIDTICSVLSENLPQIVSMGFDVLIKLIDGIISALPELISYIPQLIVTIVSVLVKNLPKILKMGMDIHLEFIKGIGKVISKLGQKIAEIASLIWEKLTDGLKNIADIGKNLVEGLWNGISEKTEWVLDKIRGFGESVMNGLKSFFGIASPSKLMRDQVGRYLADGIGVGFENEMKSVTKDMQNAIPSEFDTTATLSGVSGQMGAATAFDDMVSAFKEALYSVKIEMDDEEMGRFVDKTVTRLVYT